MKIKGSWNIAARSIGFNSFKEYFISELWHQFVEDYRFSKMPDECIMCGFKKIMYYHAKIDRLGDELLTDVVPACRYCYDKLYVLERDRNSRRLDYVVANHLGWSNEKRLGKFAAWLPAWTKFKPKKFHEAKKISRNNNDFSKIANDIANFRSYVREGYTDKQLASIYNVNVSYVRGYINKYPEQVLPK